MLKELNGSFWEWLGVALSPPCGFFLCHTFFSTFIMIGSKCLRPFSGQWHKLNFIFPESVLHAWCSSLYVTDHSSSVSTHAHARTHAPTPCDASRSLHGWTGQRFSRRYHLKTCQYIMEQSMCWRRSDDACKRWLNLQPRIFCTCTAIHSARS